jgi:hypothetical protein
VRVVLVHKSCCTRVPQHTLLASELLRLANDGVHSEHKKLVHVLRTVCIDPKINDASEAVRKVESNYVWTMLDQM